MPELKNILPAPRVPEADENGGLPPKKMEETYDVYLTVWDNVEEGDTYRLLRDGNPFYDEPDTIGTIASQEPGSEVQLPLLRLLFATGGFTLNFDVKRKDGSFLHGSDGVKLHVRK